MSGERDQSSTPHRILNPESLGKPSGYSHAVAAAPGRTIYIAGQTAHTEGQELPDDIVEQFDRAARNVVIVLQEAGASPSDLVSMTIFTTDLADYMSMSKKIGAAYQKHFGKHYPAAALVEVKGLVGGAKVELVCTAVLP